MWASILICNDVKVANIMTIENSYFQWRKLWLWTTCNLQTWELVLWVPPWCMESLAEMKMGGLNVNQVSIQILRDLIGLTIIPALIHLSNFGFPKWMVTIIVSHRFCRNSGSSLNPSNPITFYDWHTSRWASQNWFAALEVGASSLPKLPLLYDNCERNYYIYE